LTCYKFPVSAVTFTENENPSKANRCRIQNNTDLIEKCHKVNLKKATVSFSFVVSGFGVDSSCLIHMPSSFMSREFIGSNHPTEIRFWKAGIVRSWQLGRSTNGRVVLFSRNDF